jgi:hypothetical protein
MLRIRLGGVAPKARQFSLAQDAKPLQVRLRTDRKLGKPVQMGQSRRPILARLTPAAPPLSSPTQPA